MASVLREDTCVEFLAAELGRAAFQVADAASAVVQAQVVPHQGALVAAVPQFVAFLVLFAEEAVGNLLVFTEFADSFDAARECACVFTFTFVAVRVLLALRLERVGFLGVGLEALVDHLAGVFQHSHVGRAHVGLGVGGARILHAPGLLVVGTDVLEARLTVLVLEFLAPAVVSRHVVAVFAAPGLLVVGAQVADAGLTLLVDEVLVLVARFTRVGAYVTVDTVVLDGQVVVTGVHAERRDQNVKKLGHVSPLQISPPTGQGWGVS